MLAVLAARDVKTSMKEEFYGAEYALTFTEPALVKKWRNAKTNNALKLPESNIFLPNSLDIIPYKGRIQLTHQTLKGLEKEGLPPGLLKRLESLKGTYWRSLDEILSSVDVASRTENSDELREVMRKRVLGDPQILQDDHHGKIWFQQDFRFEIPIAHLKFRITTP